MPKDHPVHLAELLWLTRGDVAVWKDTDVTMGDGKPGLYTLCIPERWADRTGHHPRPCFFLWGEAWDRECLGSAFIFFGISDPVFEGLVIR